ncbi:MAG: hypothetical protein OIN83_09685 [Candidatus Methanoperedens sp.]|nr:hypothetical protein [Candidatus Methanoperedens sp.]
MRSSIILVIIFLLAAISAAFLIADKKDTEVMIVNVTLARPPDDDTEKIISTVGADASYVKRMEIPGDTPLFTPGITVMVLQDQKEKTGWNSIAIPQSGSIYRKYSLTVRLLDPIDKSKPIKILARVVSPTGTEMSVKMTEVMVS